MERQEKHIITWRGEQIGFLIDPVPDMWYLDGKLELLESPMAENFKSMAEKMDAREVMKNPVKGTRVTIQLEENDEPAHCLIHSLTGDDLFLKRVFDKEAVKWLIENVE